MCLLCCLCLLMEFVRETSQQEIQLPRWKFVQRLMGADLKVPPQQVELLLFSGVQGTCGALDRYEGREPAAWRS
jgi:hypothetical protein